MVQAAPSHFRLHIEEHFENLDLDVVCRKRKNSYSIYWYGDDTPIARLKPVGRNDEVEVFWWDRDRWVQVEEFGLVLPLEDALEYITDDPTGLFFDGRDERDDVIPSGIPETVSGFLLAKELHRLMRQLFWCILSASIAGGVCSTPINTLICCGATLAGFGLLLCIRGSLKEIVFGTVATICVASFFAIPCATIGGGVNQALDGGFWGVTLGMVVGGIAVIALYLGNPFSWLVGFWFGIIAAFWLVNAFSMEATFGRMLLTATLASTASTLYGRCMTKYHQAIRPIVEASSGAELLEDRYD